MWFIYLKMCAIRLLVSRKLYRKFKWCDRMDQVMCDCLCKLEIIEKKNK